MKKTKSNMKTPSQSKKSTQTQASENPSALVCTLITGASAGIGEAVAYKLSEKGANLILVARRKEKLNQVKKTCLALGAKAVFVMTADLSQKKSLEKLTDQINNKKQLHNKVKVKLEVKNLINNAGLAKGVQLIPQAQLNDWETMIDTNIKGVFALTRLLCHSIISQKGHIINLGSVAGRLVYEGGAVYCATKFAIRAFTEGLRMDLKGTGVRVTNISPGMVNTEFSYVRLGDQKKADAVYAGMTPLSANDIASNILWCLEQPQHVNIQELVVYPTDQASVGQVTRKS